MDSVRMALRRLAVLACALVVALAALLWLGRVLGGIGWGPVTVALMVCAIPLTPSLGFAVADGVAGFLVRMLARDPPGFVLPGLWSDEDEIVAPTAILLTLRGEAPEPALARLDTLLAGLDASRWGELFAAFVLSGTLMGPAAEAERLAVVAHPRIGYHRGAEGGLADFLASREGFEFAVLLDADTVMTPEAALRLVRILQARRDLATVQHLSAGLPASTPFARLRQFGARAEERVRATGAAWWQGAAGRFSGANAAIRLAAWREQPLLAQVGSDVQAALLHAAHWGVMVWPDSRGSFRAFPADIRADEAASWQRFRTTRAERHLVRGHGLRALGRPFVLTGLTPVMTAPLYVVIAALAAWLAWRGASAPGAWILLYAWALGLDTPKLLGYAEVLLRRRARARYGGALALWRSIAVETGFAVALGAIRPVSRTLSLVIGGPRRPRGDAPFGVLAVLRHLPHTALGVALLAGFAHAGWRLIFVLPPLAALVLAIPFVWASASPRLGRALASAGIAATPEDARRI